jgi:transposase
MSVVPSRVSACPGAGCTPRPGSPEQQVERARIARLRAREAGRRKDWCEKTSTSLARRFDLIRFTCNADVNASINIAAGHAGGTPASAREPQLLASLTGRDAVGIPRLWAGEDVN